MAIRRIGLWAAALSLLASAGLAQGQGQLVTVGGVMRAAGVKGN